MIKRETFKNLPPETPQNSVTIRSRFLKLLVGPVITLVVGVVSGPVITHLYSPEAFGFYASMLGIIGITAALTTLRFDQLAVTSVDPEANFWLVLVFSSLGALISLALSCLFLSPMWALFIAAMTLLTGVFSGLYYLTLRKDQPLRSSSGKAVQATHILAAQSGFGWFGSGSAGLALGELLGRLIGIAWFWQKITPRTYESLQMSFHKQWGSARWLIPGALLGAISLQLLPLGMAYVVGATSAGVFLMVYRMLAVPNTLVSRVAADTLLVELHSAKNNRQKLGVLVEGAVSKLIIVAFCLYGCVAIFGDVLFNVILGPGWENAGELVSPIAVFVGCWSIASPLASVFVVLEKTLWSTIFGFMDISNRALALAVGAIYQDVQMAALVLALGAVFVYGFSVAVALNIARVSLRAIILRTFPALAVVLLSLLLSSLSFQAELLVVSFICAVFAVSVTVRSIIHG